MTTETLQVPANLQSLDEEIVSRFGPYCLHAWLCLLVALTGRTPCPVSARMVVGAVDIQDDIIRFIIQLLGKDRVASFEHISGAGLLSLGSEQFKSLDCLCLVGKPRDPETRQLFCRLLEHRPIRALDGSPTGMPRDREVVSRTAMLIRQGDAWNDTEVPAGCLTIRFDPSNDAVSHMAMQKLALCQGDPASLSPKLAKWRSALEGWPQSDVAFNLPGIDDIYRNLKTKAEVHQLTALLSLSKAWAMLIQVADAGSDPIQIEPPHLRAVLHLLHEVKSPAHIARLPRPAADCLGQLQNLRDSFLRNTSAQASATGANHRVANRAVTHTGPFTYYKLQNDRKFSSFSIDAIRIWFKTLENAGFLQEKGKVGRAKAFDLTEAGQQWKPGLLASELRSQLYPVLNDANSDI